MLTLQNSWYDDGHHFVRWRPVSQGLLRAAKLSLGKQLKSYLSLRCTHVKGRGGAKATVRFAQVMADALAPDSDDPVVKMAHTLKTKKVAWCMESENVPSNPCLASSNTSWAFDNFHYEVCKRPRVNGSWWPWPITWNGCMYWWPDNSESQP